MSPIKKKRFTVSVTCTWVTSNVSRWDLALVVPAKGSTLSVGQHRLGCGGLNITVNYWRGWSMSSRRGIFNHSRTIIWTRFLWHHVWECYLRVPIPFVQLPSNFHSTAQLKITLIRIWSTLFPLDPVPSTHLPNLDLLSIVILESKALRSQSSTTSERTQHRGTHFVFKNTRNID